KLRNKRIVCLYRGPDRNIIRRCEANRLQKLASDIGHCLCVGEIGWGVLWGLVHVAKYLGDAQLTCGHGGGITLLFCDARGEVETGWRRLPRRFGDRSSLGGRGAFAGA